MSLLLDTCTFLWLIQESPELSTRAREVYLQTSNQVFLSSISVWEIAIKNRLGRLPLPEPADQFIHDQRQRHGIDALPFDEAAAAMLFHLPHIHRDPFDRALIAQAQSHDLTILTPDPHVRRYAVATEW